ncbi:MAG: leucine-rich repeat protein, partial [Abditibacteriota bacterium]|nr:leucine-rich repeat protein [Abditibacteriota bacterium]
FYVHDNGLGFTSEAPFYNVDKGEVDFSGFSVYVKSVNISKRSTNPIKSDAGFAMLPLPALKDAKPVAISKESMKEGDKVLIIGYSPKKHSLIINHNEVGAPQENVFTLAKPIDDYFTGAPVLNMDGEIMGLVLISDADDPELNLLQDIAGLGEALKDAEKELAEGDGNTERVLATDEDDEDESEKIYDTVIGGYTFTLAGSSLLEVKGKGDTVRIPTTVEFLCDRCFEGVEAEELIIPSSVRDIEMGAFYDTMVEKISVNSGNKDFVSKDGILFTKDKKTLVCYPAGKKAESYVLDKGLETICDLAFYDCKYLRNLTVPVSLVQLGDNCILDVSGKLTITGYEDTVMQQYAEDHDIKFKTKELTDTDIKFLRELEETLSSHSGEI